MKKQTKIDFAVAKLYDEEDYWQKVIAVPLLQQEHLDEIMKYKRHYEKHTTLADWKDYTAKEIHRQSIPTANTMSNGTAHLLTPPAQQETPSPPTSACLY